MNRKQFLYSAALILGLGKDLYAGKRPKPERLVFEDDGLVPNSSLPLLLYRNAFGERDDTGASWLEQKFLTNNWSNSWRNGIFTFQHYHSIAHEVLGIYSGEVLVLLGGEKGKRMELAAGDIVVIPAGVGHKNLEDHNLGVVGAYPNGMPVDILRARPEDRPKADENIAQVPLPKNDPLLGESDGLKKIWI
ncbi:MAG: cupin [Cyclobacteriaceae bacterium]